MRPETAATAALRWHGAVHRPLPRLSVRRQGDRLTRQPMKAHGTELTSDWGTVVPTLHPAFVRRRGLGGLEYRTLVADLKHARRVALGPGSVVVPGRARHRHRVGSN